MVLNVLVCLCVVIFNVKDNLFIFIILFCLEFVLSCVNVSVTLYMWVPVVSVLCCILRFFVVVCLQGLLVILESVCYLYLSIMWTCSV